jgi:hypothetical protein
VPAGGERAPREAELLVVGGRVDAENRVGIVGGR